MVANEFPRLETSVSKEIECELQQCCRLIHLSKRGVEDDVHGAVSHSSRQNCICMCCLNVPFHGALPSGMRNHVTSS